MYISGASSEKGKLREIERAEIIENQWGTLGRAMSSYAGPRVKMDHFNREEAALQEYTERWEAHVGNMLIGYLAQIAEDLIGLTPFQRQQSYTKILRQVAVRLRTGYAVTRNLLRKAVLESTEERETNV